MLDRTGEQPAGQRADQDGDEGTSLDQRIATDQFVVVQMLRDDRVLDRPEQRRMAAEQEQRAHQDRQAVQEETGGGDAHDHHFQHLDQAGEHRLVVFVGQLPGGRREQEEGQDEDASRHIGKQPRRQRRPLGGLESQQDNQRVLEQVVVEGAEELGGEERREATGIEQAELGTHARFLNWLL
jgi:hypothetical protein